MTSPAYCESCGRKASDGARFCGGCGRSFGPPAGSPPPVRGAPADAAKAPARGGGTGAGTGAGKDAEETVFELRPLAVQTLWQLLLCIVTVGIAWLFLWVHRMGLRYRITNQRIEIVTGVVTVTRRTVDLFRVRDLELVEPFFLRQRAAGHITVSSHDVGEPVLTLSAVRDVHAVHETLRDLVAAERRRQKVHVVEDER